MLVFKQGLPVQYIHTEDLTNLSSNSLLKPRFLGFGNNPQIFRPFIHLSPFISAKN